MNRTYLIIFLVIAVGLLAVLGPLLRKETVFNIEDKCGRFVNLFSHTIEHEEACRTRCRSQCSAADYDYKKVEFELKNGSCNTCTCYCA